MHRALRTACLALTLAIAAAPLAATTYVAMADADLAAQAPVIAEVRIEDVSPSPAAGTPATDYLVEIQRLVKGYVPGGNLIVRVPGGERPGGLSLIIFGAPHFEEGDVALLFLLPADDGSFRVLHLMLGAFHRLAVGEETFAVRNLSEAREVADPLTGEKRRSEPGVRDYEAFISWLREGAGPQRDGSASYFVAPPPGLERELAAKFTLLGRPPARWFEFDTGGEVRWRAHAGGQPGLAGGGFAEVRRGLEAWNADPATPIRLVYDGTTNASAGFTDPAGDGLNTVLWGDPNDEAAGSYSCFGGGGVLAVGGVRGDGTTRTFLGRLWQVILEAEIITNNGLDCFLTATSGATRLAQVLGHELGHTLGFGHSCGDAFSPPCTDPVLNDALMRASVHLDGRGPELNADDLAAARFVYAQGGGGGGGGGGPAAPSGLAVVLDRLAALMIWKDNAGDEDGYRIYRAAAGGSMTLIAELDANATGYTDASLQPATAYSFQVAAFNAGGERRSAQVQVTTPAAVPVTAALIVPAGPMVAGEPVRFTAAVTGPAESARWSFGGDARGYSQTPCGDALLCATHIFTQPGTYPVEVEVVGDLGQTSRATASVTVGGAAAELSRRESVIQSVIFGPRGNTGTFESNCWLHNAGAEAALAEVTYLPRGAGNPDPESRLLTLDAGASVFLPNVLAGLFDESDSQGSLGLAYLQPMGGEVAEPDLRTICRSFVQLPGRASSFGQFVGEEAGETWSAAPKVVTGILQNDDFGSTVLAANVDDRGGQVFVELLDAAGQTVGEPGVLTLGQRTMRFRPVARLFPEAADRQGPFTARFTSSGIRFVASATLLESSSEDQIFVAAREADDANPVFVPRVARSESQFNAFLVSQLIARNNSAQPTTLEFQLWRRGQSNLDPLTTTRTLEGNGVLVVDDVIRDLFALEDGVGALRVEWTNAEGIAPRILTYAFNRSDGGAGPRFGMLVDSRAAEAAGTASTIDFGAEQSALFKADFGVLNLNAGATRIRVTVRRADGTPMASTELTLRAQQHLERNLEGIFRDVQLGTGSNWTVETEVLTGGPILTYLANINQSGDIFFVPGRPAPAAN